jgi:hypothetical protein
LEIFYFVGYCPVFQWLVFDFAIPFSQFLPDFDETVDLPKEIHDPVFFYLEVDTKRRCHHGEMPARKVAVDMAATGRRIFGCNRGCNREVSGKCPLYGCRLIRFGPYFIFDMILFIFSRTPADALFSPRLYYICGAPLHIVPGVNSSSQIPREVPANDLTRRSPSIRSI